ncbi:hypothetical protein RD792_011194 [Penstemon davidsonii]|uniref:Flavin-containing monooxygenase n=1 Tax=Penstemon davidsonii TaxID=160366 RepID=A0ABR0D3X4_9LAMI|nr:hypothetical protein RD792_011194 [Penstemon davidsonii]
MDSSISCTEQKKEKNIAIIGAGISGLLACKHAMEKGFNPVVFETRPNIGGAWSSTMDSTKLQTPKDYFQFSDFPWPDSVSETFPNHNQVMNYIKSYALRFNIFPQIKFNAKVISIDYISSVDEDMSSWSLWGGTGEAFSRNGNWNVFVQDMLNPMEPLQVHEVDFVILCNGKFSDLPNVPDIQISKGENAFNGEVIHSMDYGAMDKIEAAKFIEDKKVVVVGNHKSGLDIAAEVVKTNGVRHPCTLVFRRAIWSGSETLARNTFKNMNRFSELMIHKPREGFILWFLAVLLSPLLWIFSKLMECNLKWKYPLKKYNMVPDHSFFKQLHTCTFTILPQRFYDFVKEGSLVLKKSQTINFCENGLVLEDEDVPLETDIVIFATGYKSDQKISNIFTSSDFKKCITGSSAPFYRECIHPKIPQLAILGYSESPSTLFTFEMRSKWLAYFLAGKFKLPTIKEMEEDAKEWEKNARRYNNDDENYKRACVGALLQIHCNDQLCKDMGCNPKKKKWPFQELFSTYHPSDYADI